MDNPIEKFNAATDAAAERYSEWTLARMAVPYLPLVGTALDAFFGGRGQAVVQARFARMLAELKAQAEQLEEGKVDYAYMESEAFFDVARRAFEASQRTADQTKVKLCARVLLRTAQAAPYRESAEEFLDVLAALNANEIAVASAMFDGWGEFAPMPNRDRVELELYANPEQLLTRLPGFSRQLIAVYLRRIERWGLVSEVEGMIVDYQGDSYYVTDYFRNLMAFLALEQLVEADASAQSADSHATPPP